MGAALHINQSLFIEMEDVKPAFRNIHQDLIDGCISGDQKAQFQVYKLYYKAMFNTSLRIVNDTMEAEDIMQESFLSAFEKIGTYSGVVSFGAWLKKIVVNRSLDTLNSRKAIYENIDERYDISDESYNDDETGEETSMKIEEIKGAVNRLPDGYRVILSLYLLEGYDHDEIGEIMGISSSTSRSQLSRAKQKLILELNGKKVKS